MTERHFRFARASFSQQHIATTEVSIDRAVRHGRGERLMQRMFWSSLAIALLMSPATYGQSLGDTARENRDKREAEEAAGTAPKVITNKDLPKDPNANPDSPGTKPGAGTPASSASDGSAEQRSADQRSVQQRLAEQR